MERVGTAIKQEFNGKKANCVLKIKVYDPADDRFYVDMPSKKFRVHPDNDLIDSLQKLAELEF
jgi:hypothetical protein